MHPKITEAMKNDYRGFTDERDYLAAVEHSFMVASPTQRAQTMQQLDAVLADAIEPTRANASLFSLRRRFQKIDHGLKYLGK
jgi:hypothetical protein